MQLMAEAFEITDGNIKLLYQFYRILQNEWGLRLTFHTTNQKLHLNKSFNFPFSLKLLL